MRIKYTNINEEMEVAEVLRATIKPTSTCNVYNLSLETINASILLKGLHAGTVDDKIMRDLFEKGYFDLTMRQISIDLNI